MSIFEDRLKQLNARQRQAVETTEGPVMVIAGPGSGKTELLSLRVANILRTVDISPGNILCLTFTEAAAFNMRQRLAGLIGRQAYRVAIHTFHSFGVEIINRYPEHFYNGAAFVPADDITQIEILETIFSELEYGNPLRSVHNDQFTYLRKTKNAIEYLKKAGLTPAEFGDILAENRKALAHADPIIQAVFNDRIAKKMFPRVTEAIGTLSKYSAGPRNPTFKPFTQALCDSLTEALDYAERENSTSPLTEWKKQWTAKGEDKQTHLADLLDMEKMEALAGIYGAYVNRMREASYYDYNDMILDTIAMLEKNVGVRLDLQERYHYVLVDEFQDTNDAQMRILRLLTDHPVHEGRPNIMVVGDDDQAIYKFQGAEISNIIDFRKSYPDSATVVLKENYRSTQSILDAARHIIKKGVGRLENILPDLQKELVAANKTLEKGSITGKEFHTRDVEYQWIADEVKRRIDAGTKPTQIAVIAREHKELEALVPHFHAAHIPIAYERQQDALREPHIEELVTMARFVSSLMKKENEADDLLPAILNYPFWGLERPAIWELSIRAYEEKKPWLLVMRQSGGRLKEIADFFIELGGRAAYATAEEILHELIGGPQQLLPDEDSEDAVIIKHDMFSPFRAHYFSKSRFEAERADYLRFLSSLQSFVGALREYHRGRPVSTQDMVAFVDMHAKNNLAINNVSPFVSSTDAVQFMSAHKAKGLEFDAVFVINCQESVWADSGRGRNVPLPANLPISPAGDTLDDQLRLFYVAVTRARKFLYLTSYRLDERGKESARLGFLAPSEGTQPLFPSEFVDIGDMNRTAEEILVSGWDNRRARTFVHDEKALLKPILEDYQLSVTHLQNFLNVAEAGPMAFLEKNLLRFPEPKSTSGALGSAVHSTIQRIYDHLKSKEKHPETAEVVAWFEGFLADERLNESDFALMIKRGTKALEAFYAEKKAMFSPQDKSEFNFKSQGVIIGDAHLTGKIDRIAIDGTHAVVTDFKTGKALAKWESSDPYEKIKIWRYRQQLVFYKLLIEHSRDFAGKYSVQQGIISFVEPHRGTIVELPADIQKEEVERMTALIGAVYKKIKALDLPDISAYPKNVEGIAMFEEDLLSERES